MLWAIYIGISMAYGPNTIEGELSQNNNVIQRTGLEGDIDSINSLFVDQGYGDVGQFMKNIAATESNLGSDELGDYSFSPFQIDDIRYKDIVQRAQENPGSKASKRADLVNEYLQNALDRPDFNILDLDLQKEGHNPLIGAALTRMGLASVPEGVPEDLQGQSEYWKKHWNTEAGAGTPEHFISQVGTHYPAP
jgi:hypothetical protein